jgi:hypothetical protein
MRRILSDWWEEEMYEMTRDDALGKLVGICTNKSVRLPALAHGLQQVWYKAAPQALAGK